MLKTFYRSHACDELSEKNIDKEVQLVGWVDRRRDHGGLIFIDLRDRFGITQIVTDPELSGNAHKIFETVRPEWVLQIIGKVRARPAGQENSKMATGKIEILVSEVKVLNEAETPPFEIADENDENEEVRLKFRYLDLRRKRLQSNIVLRHKLLQATRKFFYDQDFVEIETPILIKGTPEGAREYIVPSRVHAGKFYVLPQSPQQLKQLSMVAGFDRYMQIARCFRDEDQRGDRQPEFTQMDLEMSFVDSEDVMNVNEAALIAITKECRPDAKLKFEKFPRLTFDDAMNRYGSDKPDLRYELEFNDISEECKGCGFGIFANVVESGGVIKILRVPSGAKFSRKDIEELTEAAKIYGAKGLAWIKISEKFEGVPVEKLGADLTKKIVDKCGGEKDDILLFAADEWETACNSLGAVRIAVAEKLKLLEGKENEFAFAWITDFPMFAKDGETGELASIHHPFTRPKNPADLDSDPLKARAEAYDVILNGYEIGGGSVRIHERDLQKKIFDILKISDEDAERRFGHILKAFSFGAPPHGGIAWGLDRIAMLFAGEPNIREVIAFPKTNKAEDLMLGAPDIIPAEQLKEANIRSTADVKKTKRDVFLEIVELLESNKIKFEKLEHAPVKTSAEAAQVRGTTLEQAARALVWKTENGYIQSVCSAAKEVDEAKLKKVAEVKKLELAKPEEVKKITGCEIGCVPPFGNLFDLPVFVDKSLEPEEIIVFNAGEHTKSIKMPFADYIKIIGSKTSEFAK
ncbi:MAG: aspartate--tRNA ligase [Candidatus Peribacteraceae bacterium]|nr:aspartate--tRNA ligase [Candidatus Peribacteraceae bacterium]